MSANAFPPRTEGVHPGSVGIDTRSDVEVLSILMDGQRQAVESVSSVLPQLAKAAALGAEALGNGGRLIYVASGSPALMSLADALEIPQTYGIAYDRIVLILADGDGIAKRLNGVREDRDDEARKDVAAQGVGPADCVIATSASGSTRYTVGGLEAAKAAGARTIGIAGNAAAPLFAHADVSILLDAGPELISGSTRMGAGTAQKVALNMLSTLIGIRLGHVHDGLMVNVKADNDKLRARAARIVTTITGASAEVASAALATTAGEVKPAILLAAGAGSLADAEAMLNAAKGNIRQALSALASGESAQTY